jgi:hypothetical protein
VYCTMHSSGRWGIYEVRLSTAPISRCAFIDAYYLTTSASVLAYLTSSANSLEGSALDQFSSTYCLLLYVPPEYLTKQARAVLVHRAMEGDVTISSSLHATTGEKTAKGKRKHDEGRDLEDMRQTLMYIRVFLQRMGKLGYLNTSDHEVCLQGFPHFWLTCVCSAPETTRSTL